MKTLKHTVSTTVTFTVPIDWDEFSADAGMDAVSHDPSSYLELTFDDMLDLLSLPDDDVRPNVKAFLKQVEYSIKVKGLEPDAVGFCKD